MIKHVTVSIHFIWVSMYLARTYKDISYRHILLETGPPFYVFIQPREGLEVCRAKEVPSLSWVIIRPGNRAHDLRLCIQALYKLITCFCQCDIPAKTYSKMMTDITFSRWKDRGFTPCGAHYLWLTADWNQNVSSNINALRRVDAYVKDTKTPVGKFE